MTPTSKPPTSSLLAANVNPQEPPTWLLCIVIMHAGSVPPSSISFSLKSHSCLEEVSQMLHVTKMVRGWRWQRPEHIHRSLLLPLRRCRGKLIDHPTRRLPTKKALLICSTSNSNKLAYRALARVKFKSIPCKYQKDKNWQMINQRKIQHLFSCKQISNTIG